MYTFYLKSLYFYFVGKRVSLAILLTKINSDQTMISNYMIGFHWGMITHSYLNFSGGVKGRFHLLIFIVLWECDYLSMP